MNKIILIICLILIFMAGLWFVWGRDWLKEKLLTEEEPVAEELIQEEENQSDSEKLIEILVEDPAIEAGAEEGEVSVVIPNPAANFCFSQGYEYKTAVNSDGSQYGVCVFGETACPGWDYYQGKCQPGERPVKYISQ